MKDRRRHHRIPADHPVRIFIDEESWFPGRLRDISFGGMFVVCDPNLIMGSCYRAEVVLWEPDDPINIWVEGQVVRCTNDGIGFRIAPLYQHSFDRLRELILFESEGVADGGCWV